MNGSIRERWVLLLVLCVFVACKIPHLSYAYYWDESWPYATAIKAMYNNGISFMPGAIDAELSRGHPLFFHVLAAGWMKVFGDSHVAMHSFALLISVLFLVAIYEVCLKIFNPRVAVMALLLVASQEVFFVQSSFVLLEVLVAFLCFLSLYFYVRDKYLLAAVCLAALFYIKESGLVMGFVLGIDAVVRIFGKNADRKAAVLRLLSIGAPCVLIGVFFLLQKHTRGWYIFPFYNDIIEHSWKMFWYKFRIGGMKDTFGTSLKYYYFILLALLAIAAAIKSKTPKYLALLLPLVIIYYFVDDMRAGRILPSIPFFIVFVVGWFWSVRVLSRIFGTPYQRRFVALVGCFIFVFLCFSAMNYYTYRYMMATIIPLLVVTAALLDVFIAQTHRTLYHVSLASFTVISYFAYSTNEGFGDADLGAFTAVAVHQAVVDHMEESGYYDKQIGTGLFLARQHLIDPSTGFLGHGRTFKHVEWKIDSATEIVIFDNIEQDYRYDRIKKDTSFILERRVAKKGVWAEIYRRK